MSLKPWKGEAHLSVKCSAVLQRPAQVFGQFKTGLSAAKPWKLQSPTVAPVPEAWMFATINVARIKTVTDTDDNNNCSKIQTHKWFKITLFIRTKHNMHIFGVIPSIKLQNNT